MRPDARCTFTLSRTGLLLRVDQFVPHNFRQFSTEQSIVTLTKCILLFGIILYIQQCNEYETITIQAQSHYLE